MQHTVLLIDYEPRSIEQMRSALESHGYRVLVAPNGIDGIRTFHDTQPDLTLIEAMLPKKHGFEVCQELKATEHGKNHPVALMTAIYKGQKYRLQAEKDYGCDAYLEKPITDDLLLEEVGTLLKAVEPGEPLAEIETTLQAEVKSEELHVASAPPFVPAKGSDSAAEDEIESRLEEILPDLAVAPAAMAEERASAALLLGTHDSEESTQREEEINDLLDAAFDQIGSALNEVAQSASPAEPAVGSEPVEPDASEEIDAVLENLDAGKTTGSDVEPGDPEQTDSFPANNSQDELSAPPERLRNGLAGISPGEEIDFDGVESLSLASEKSESKIPTPEPPISAKPVIAPDPVSLPEAASFPAKPAEPPWTRETEEVLTSPAEETLARFEETRRPLPIWAVALAALVVIGALIGWYLVGPGSTDQSGRTETDPATETSTTEKPVSQNIAENQPFPLEDVSDSPIQLGAGSAAPILTIDAPPATPVEKIAQPAEKPAPKKASRSAAPTPKTENRPKIEKPAEPSPTKTSDPPPTTRKQEAANSSSTSGDAVVPVPTILAGSDPINSVAWEFDSSFGFVMDKNAETTKPEAFEMDRFKFPEEPVIPKAKYGEYYSIDEIDTRPAATSKPLPSYAARDLRGKPSAQVMLRLRVDENGKVPEVEWIHGSVSAKLQRDVLEAVHSWSFRPAQKDGVAVKTDIQVSVNFTS